MHRQRELLSAASALGPPRGRPLPGEPPAEDSLGLVAAVSQLRPVLAFLQPLVAHMNAKIAEAARASSSSSSLSSSAESSPPGGEGGEGGEGGAGGLTVEATAAALEWGAATFAAGASTAAPSTVAGGAAGQHGADAGPGDEPWLPPKVAYQEQQEPEAFFVPYVWRRGVRPGVRRGVWAQDYTHHHNHYHPFH